MRLRLATALAALAAGLAPGVPGAAPVTTEYLYNLSTSTGAIRSNGVALAYDPYNKEVVTLGEGQVRVFNDSGMEVYAFVPPPELGGVQALAPLENGDMLLLAFVKEEDRLGVYRANYRGEVLSRVELKGFPPELKDFQFNAMGEGKGRVFLADLAGMRVAVTDHDGNFLAFHDVAKMIDEDVAKKRENYGLKGFRVSPSGDLLFTIQPLFRGYILQPDGTLRAFGQRGSAPGKFNVVAGIAQDEKGYVYVTDILKSAVLVFDPELKWVKEFGYRGRHVGAIVAPVDIVAGEGKVFVSQFARRGVAVFKVTPVEVQ